MLSAKSIFAFAVLIPLVGAAIPAEAAKSNTTATRAACFHQAAAARAAAGPGARSEEKQADSYDAYSACCRKAGILP
jgi:hypothetical protein